MKINEVIMDMDHFHALADAHLMMDNPSALHQMINSPLNKFKDGIAGTLIYRAWFISETMLRKLERNIPVTINTKATRLSYSWTRRGAMASTDDDRPGRRDIPIVVKKHLLKSEDVLLNLYQYALEFEEADTSYHTEREVIVPASEYYRTINPVEILSTSFSGMYNFGQ